MDNGNMFFLWCIITSVTVLATIFAIRYLRNKENMALIERGLNPLKDEVQKARPRPFASLRIGLPLLGAGFGLFLASVIDLNMGHIGDEITGVYFGLITALCGLGFFLSYKIEMKWWKEDEDRRK
ncbi:MAG: hypothetical protein DI598_08690 [Pseudopedobacter saltans]|uniref:DUF6249 domain-containing protein n=1 Tax=Pseudopedobacter saltans TaxID=151895 RepID=A0A2W5H029_9SPHI|nr:MAG: hypothetical protein DI598_08690 [Pseudopedobacter saltans]